MKERIESAFGTMEKEYLLLCTKNIKFISLNSYLVINSNQSTLFQ
jgi:hypothetical protein